MSRMRTFSLNTQGRTESQTINTTRHQLTGDGLRAMLNENSFHLAPMKTADFEPGILDKLRAGGYKLTPQRRAVVRALATSPRHLTPAQLHTAAQRETADVGLVTVYRTLHVLVDLNMVCEISVDGRQPTYLLRRPQKHHHHVVCSGCGRVVDFTSDDIERLGQRLARETSFVIEGHVLEFTGRCPNCREVAA